MVSDNSNLSDNSILTLISLESYLRSFLFLVSSYLFSYELRECVRYTSPCEPIPIVHQYIYIYIYIYTIQLPITCLLEWATQDVAPLPSEMLPHLIKPNLIIMTSDCSSQ